MFQRVAALQCHAPWLTRMDFHAVLAEESRVLVFSQFTLTLDVLEEYCQSRFGPEGQGYLRLVCVCVRERDRECVSAYIYMEDICI